MTTTETNTHELARDLLELRETIATLRERAQDMEATLLAAIRAAGGKALPDSEFRIELEAKGGGFDKSRWVVAKDMDLPDDEVAACYIPEHQEITTVPEEWHTQRFKAMANKYGGRLLEVYEESRLLGTERLIVERK